MESTLQITSRSNAQRWTGFALSGLPALFLLVDAVAKLFKPAPVVDATTKLGFSESLILPLGVILLIGTLVYLVPRTTTLGAILLTGYLGGAVATHVRMDQGLFPILFPVVIGALLWGGLYLRDGRLQALIPLSMKAPAAASKKMLWVGRILSFLPALLLLFSAVMKLMQPPQVVEGFAHFGYPEQSAIRIGLLELICTVLYLVPQTAVLGAILLTGYMGGAAITHLRLGEPVFLHVLIGAILWGGLYLRDERLRSLLPLRS